MKYITAICALLTSVSFSSTLVVSSINNGGASGTLGNYSYTSTSVGTGAYALSFTNNGATDVDGLGQNDTHSFVVTVRQYADPTYTVDSNEVASVTDLGSATDYGYTGLNGYTSGVNQLISVEFTSNSFSAGENGSNTSGYISSDVTFNSLSGLGNFLITGSAVQTYGGSDLSALTGNVSSTHSYDGDQDTIYVIGTEGNDGLNRIRNAEVTFDIATNVVPEPSSAALLGLGSLAMVVRRRR